MSDKYMIDSSVWIPYFRDKEYKLKSLIKELIEKDSVYINGIIQTELLKVFNSVSSVSSVDNFFKVSGYGVKSCAATLLYSKT